MVLKKIWTGSTVCPAARVEISLETASASVSLPYGRNGIGYPSVPGQTITPRRRGADYCVHHGATMTPMLPCSANAYLYVTHRKSSDSNEVDRKRSRMRPSEDERATKGSGAYVPSPCVACAVRADVAPRAKHSCRHRNRTCRLARRLRHTS